MGEEQEHVRKTGPSGRAIIGWGAGSLMVLGLAVFCALAWAEVRGTQKLVQDWASPYHPAPKSIPEYIGKLGGPGRAARRLDIYLRLSDERAPHKWAAVRLLGGCGRPAARPLGRLLEDEDMDGPASYHLERLGPDAEEAADEVIAALPGSKDAARFNLIMALFNMRTDDPRAVDALLAAAGDADELTRCEALRALGALGRGNPVVLRKLVSSLESVNRNERRAAVRGLAEYWPEDVGTAGALAAALTAALKRPHAELAGGNLVEVLELVDVLAGMGERARPAEAALRKAAGDSNLLVRTAAARALKFSGNREVSRAGSAAEKLERRVDFEFVEVPFDDALEYFEYRGKVRIIPDPRAVDRWARPITLRMTRAPLKLALDWTLRLAGLDYEVRGGYVFVSTCY